MLFLRVCNNSGGRWVNLMVMQPERASTGFSATALSPLSSGGEGRKRAGAALAPFPEKRYNERRTESPQTPLFLE
jgi:hypothetical protein